MTAGVMGQKDWDERGPAPATDNEQRTLADYRASYKFSRDFNAEAAALPVLDFDARMHAYMLKTFEPFITGARALELGCFHGHMTALLLERFGDVTVIDASQDCIDAARKVAVSNSKMIEFICATFEDAVLEREFDAIFSTHVLEHCDDPVRVLNRCREWLKPKGRLFLAVPNAFSASRQIAVAMGLIKAPADVTPAESAHGHKRTYTEETLRYAAVGAGLKILDAGGIMFKALSGAQIDRALAAGIIDDAYLDGAYRLGRAHPHLCSSIYVVAGK